MALGSVPLPRRRLVPLVAAGAAVAWLPFLDKPLSSDEGGFLLVASQWSPGSSLYGNYWVDRPPLLILLFRLADAAGGEIALRILGILAVVASVGLAARLGRLLSPDSRAALLGAGAAAVFLSTPKFGAMEVDGELLACPLIMGGLVAVAQALNARERRTRLWWWCAAGVAGAAAAMIKQNMLNVFVVALVAIGWQVRHHGLVFGVRNATGLALGAATTMGALLLWSWTRGTDPSGLWDAVVTFRLQAAEVIGTSSSPNTSRRGHELAIAFAVSGAPVVLAAYLGRLREAGSSGRERPSWGLLGLPLLGWEAVGVVSGGSYWPHYLIGLVPALVLASVAVATGSARVRAWLVAGLAYAAVVGTSTAAVAGMALEDSGGGSAPAVEAYLARHARPGDTAIVAFGHPDILDAAGLSSPYPELWSLPVRVRDPRLTRLAAVLRGPGRPTWVVVDGSSLATWGVDPHRADVPLGRFYRPVAVEGSYRLYTLRWGRECVLVDCRGR